MSSANLNRPMSLKIALHDNPVLRSALAAAKVRMILANREAAPQGKNKESK